jgi:hypothetical protein
MNEKFIGYLKRADKDTLLFNRMVVGCTVLYTKIGAKMRERLTEDEANRALLRLVDAGLLLAQHQKHNGEDGFVLVPTVEAEILTDFLVLWRGR